MKWLVFYIFQKCNIKVKPESLWLIIKFGCMFIIHYLYCIYIQKIQPIFCKNMQKKRRFYTRGTLTSIRIQQLTKIPTLFPDCRISFNLEKGSLFNCIEREGDLKDTRRNICTECRGKCWSISKMILQKFLFRYCRL